MSVVTHPPPPRTTHKKKHLLAQSSYGQYLKTEVRDLHCTYTTKKKKTQKTSYTTGSAATAFPVGQIQNHSGSVVSYMPPLNPSRRTKSSCNFQWLLENLLAWGPGRSTLPIFTDSSLCVLKIHYPCGSFYNALTSTIQLVPPAN